MAGPDAIEIPITTDTTRFAAQTARATQSLLTLEKAQWAANAALGAARKAYDVLIASQIEAVRQVDRLAKTSQLTTRTVAGLRLAAQQAGLEVEDLVPKGLADRLADLRDGTQSVVDDFGLIGLSAKDFQAINYDLDASLALILDRLRDAPSAMNRAAAATRLLEGEGEVLLGTFSDGARELERFAKAAEEVGAATPQAMAAARDLADATADLSLAVESAGAGLVQWLSDSGAIGAASDAARGLSFVVGTLTGSVQRLRDTIDGEWVGLNLITFGLYGVMDALANAWPGALADGREALGKFDEANRETFRVVQGAGEAALWAWESVPESLARVAGDVQAPADALAKALKRPIEDAAMEWESYPSAMGTNLAIALALHAAHNELTARANDEARAEEQAAELAALRAWSDARAKAAADELAQIEKAKDARQSAAIASIGYAENALGSIVALADGTNSEIRGVLTAVAIAERAASVARALFQVGPAYAQGLSAAPPPFGFALGALNAGAVVAAAAAAAVAPLPRFHSGRTAPDEQTAVLKKDESVLTTSATREVIGALNAGRAASGGQIIVAIGHEAVGVAATRALQDPGSGLAKAITRGDLPGRTRRRRP